MSKSAERLSKWEASKGRTRLRARLLSLKASMKTIDSLFLYTPSSYENDKLEILLSKPEVPAVMAECTSSMKITAQFNHIQSLGHLLMTLSLFTIRA
jgi:hypothetical protein